MTIILAGDSLTAGNLGVPYTDYLRLAPGTKTVNLGLDGDTAAGVLRRLEPVLGKVTPDILVIEAGANDILLPVMRRRGGEWKSFIREMEEKGGRPAADPEEFRRTCTDILAMAAAAGILRIICVTIPPLGENPGGATEEKRRELNRIIRDVADGRGAVVADAAGAFEKALSGLEPRSDYFFDSPGDFAADLRRIRRDRSAMPLSAERGLYFTMDGAHLNEEGARLLGRVISEAVALSLEPASGISDNGHRYDQGDDRP